MCGPCEAARKRRQAKASTQAAQSSVQSSVVNNQTQTKTTQPVVPLKRRMVGGRWVTVR